MKVVMSLVLIVSLSVSAFAEKKTTAGVLLVVAGSASMLGAFNWRESCPAGYTTHTFEGLQTQCVYLSSTGSDVRAASPKITYKRPAMMYAGAGVVAGGIVLLLLPKRATQGVTLSIAPQGLRVSKTIDF